MSKAAIYSIIGVILVGAILYLVLDREEKNYENPVTLEISKGEMDVYVYATGELKAKRSTKVQGPANMRRAGVRETTIADIIPEGTVVSEGDFVARLDKTDALNRIGELEDEVEQILSQLEQAKIDTAITLRGIRDDLINLEFSKQEKELVVRQSKYEPQMIVRQAELELDRVDRDIRQLEENYRLKQIQAQAQVAEIQAKLRTKLSEKNRTEEIVEDFIIKAPSDGMLIYKSDWNGKKTKGSRISSWDPVVAELPDLTDMISKTYVNEVDISKVKKGQDVEISVDAFPGLTYTGYVLDVANIGQELRGNDVNVFEVTVQVNEYDSLLRPAMTTNNKIKVMHFENVLRVPLEGVFADSLTYAIVKDGSNVYKQELIVGESNENEVIVLHGLEEGQTIYLQYVGDTKELPLNPLDPELKAEIARAEEEARKKRQEAMAEKARQVKENYTPDNDRGNSRVFFFN